MTATAANEEEFELRALVQQACELHDAGSPYFLDACRAIVDWHERRHLRRLERKQIQEAAFRQLLRETAVR